MGPAARPRVAEGDGRSARRCPGGGACGRRVPLLLLALLGACGVFGDDDSAVEGVAPRVLGSSPATGEVRVPACGDATFTARGEDEDSLVLTWSWWLDGSLQATGDVDDGAFDTTWALPWDVADGGREGEVHFRVADDSAETEVYWPIRFDKGPCGESGG